MTKPTKPTTQEIHELIDRVSEEIYKGRSRFPGMSYEDGIRAALEWATGESDNPYDDD